MGEGTVFSLSVDTSAGRGVPHLADGGTPSQFWMGRGYSIPDLDQGGIPSQVWAGGTPSQVQMGGAPSQVQTWGYPIPGQDGGYPHLRSGGGYPILLMGGTLSKIRMVVPHPADGRVPHPRSGQGGPPLPVKTGWESPHTTLSRTGWGTLPPSPPPVQNWMGYHPSHQETDQHSEHFLRGVRCVSCVHAGGPSCS